MISDPEPPMRTMRTTLLQQQKTSNMHSWRRDGLSWPHFISDLGSPMRTMRITLLKQQTPSKMPSWRQDGPSWPKDAFLGANMAPAGSKGGGRVGNGEGAKPVFLTSDRPCELCESPS